MMMTMMKTSWWGAHMTVVDHMEWESAARASVKVMSDMFHMFNIVTNDNNSEMFEVWYDHNYEYQ